MQSTVFDFGFTLKKAENQFYIIDTKYVNIYFDFSIYNIVPPSVDFSLVSSLRFRDYGSIEFLTSEDFCANISCKSRFYIGGLYAYMSLFALQADDGFVVKPEFLIRDSLFYDVLTGRMFHFGMFLHNQTLFLVRGAIFTEITNVVYKHYATSMEDTTAYSDKLDVIEYVGINGEEIVLENSTAEAAKKISGSLFYRTIENDRRQEIILFHEKTSLRQAESVEGRFIIDDLRINIPSSIYTGGFSIDYRVISEGELEDSYFKYGIISINKDIKTVYSYKSDSQRITVNKGVL